MHSESLVITLYELYPELRRLPAANVHYYADIVTLSSSPRAVKHRWAGKKGMPENAFPIGSRKLVKKLGQGGFQRINEIASCLDVSNDYSMEKNVAKAYWISEQGQLTLTLAAEKAANNPSYLLNESGKKLRKRSNAVESKDNRKNNAVTKARLNWSVPINMRAIEQALSKNLSHLFPHADARRLFLVEGQLLALHMAGNNKNETLGFGHIPQVYTEAPSGRLYGITDLSLQNSTREARDVALHGAFDYDFENCHYCLLAHEATSAGIEAPTIRDYIRRTQEYRAWIAREVGITPKQVKKCLLMLIYGAKRNPSPFCAIAEEIGALEAEKLFKCEPFRGLQEEVARIGAWMQETARRHPKTDRIINCRKKACPKKGTSKELSHLLQGTESALLHAIIEFHGPNFLVVQHDGFVIPNYIPPEEFEACVMEATGLRMRLVHKRIKIPGIKC